jgi:hypothetical protein
VLISAIGRIPFAGDILDRSVPGRADRTHRAAPPRAYA